MPGGVLLAARAGNRMQARQTYRTINRMERRREMFHGMTQPDEPEPQVVYAAPPTQAPAPPAPPSYLVELEQLAQLHTQGVLSTEEYEAKKRQLLGL